MRYNQIHTKSIFEDEHKNILDPKKDPHRSVILKVGDLANKYKCSFGIIQDALNAGIKKELHNIHNCRLDDFKSAESKVIKNLNNDLTYYEN